jgi:hypothetical protein
MANPISLPHVRFGSLSWHLTPKGISIGCLSPRGTTGVPVTVRRVWSWFGDEIRAAAIRFDVPVELLVATICTESAGGQHDYTSVCTARRNEPGWISDIASPSRVSIGVMQTLISTARDATGLKSLSAEDLIDPAVSIDAGAAVIAGDYGLTRYDPPLVAAAYNAGGIYEDAGLANRWHLRCYPLGTGAYIDRYVSWLNDAMQLPEGKQLGGRAPTLQSLA